MKRPVSLETWHPTLELTCALSLGTHGRRGCLGFPRLPKFRMRRKPLWACRIVFLKISRGITISSSNGSVIRWGYLSPINPRNKAQTKPRILIFTAGRVA